MKGITNREAIMAKTPVKAILSPAIVIILLIVTIPLLELPSSANQDNPPAKLLITSSGAGAVTVANNPALVDDYTSPLVNPAGTATPGSFHLGGTTFDHYGLGLKHSYVSGGASLNSIETSNIAGLRIRGIALAGSYYGVTTGIESRDDYGEPRSTVQYSERTFIATTGLDLEGIGKLGMSLKSYRVNVPESGEEGQSVFAGGLGLDAGYQTELLPGLYFGLAVFDLTGTDISWKNTPSEPTETIPAKYSIGLARTLDLTSFLSEYNLPGRLILSSQITMTSRLDNAIAVGTRYVFRNIEICIRGVKRVNLPLQITTGGEIDLKFINIGMDWVQNRRVLGPNTSDTFVISAEVEY